jgi:phosphate transport system substrate-binding protein
MGSSMNVRLSVTALVLNSLALSGAALALDQNLPLYQAVEGLSGHLKSVGSDTLHDEMIGWSNAFMGRYPNVKIEVEAEGSVTATPALVAGTAQFGPMSRPMSNDEVHAFVDKFGYKAAHFRVAVDALAIYVNKDNPIPCLTVQQVNRIFSANRRSAFGGNIATWGQAGLTGEWAKQPIVLYGRNTISGTYGLFKEMALLDGDFKASLRQQSGSEEVVQHVANDKYAIGYSGIGYQAAGVRTVPLALADGEECHDTSPETAYAGKYPFARYLYVYLNKRPNEPLDPLRAEFIKYIQSKDGQTQTEHGGFYSITDKDRQEDQTLLGLVGPVGQ